MTIKIGRNQPKSKLEVHLLSTQVVRNKTYWVVQDSHTIWARRKN